jgi:ubiquinone/menaquinone biosynthesis C-methylase UbiE
MNFFGGDGLTALQAKEKAQWIAFAPVVFQVARVMRNAGILKMLEENPSGLSLHDISQRVGLPIYGVRVLLESSLGIGLVTVENNLYKATKTASFILHDQLTKVNMDFIHDVCYNGMFHLEESIHHGKPEGLKVFGFWPTIYEALSQLPHQVQKSWFAFDHFYSDIAFPEVLKTIFENKPATLLDIGGNTGKWALQCVNHDPDVIVTIMDLPGQLNMAKAMVLEKDLSHRIQFHPANLLDESQPFPKGFDVIWMSQFLDCFSEEQIKSILRRCRASLTPNGAVYILEPFWDRQRFEASAFVLQQTSIYFTVMANGNSQMYHSGNFIQYIEEAGFSVTAQKDGLGVSHTLLVCKPS